MMKSAFFLGLFKKLKLQTKQKKYFNLNSNEVLLRKEKKNHAKEMKCL